MSKAQWLKVYRLARTPDAYLADDVVLDFPVRWLIWAQTCLQNRGGLT